MLIETAHVQEDSRLILQALQNKKEQKALFRTSLATLKGPQVNLHNLFAKEMRVLRFTDGESRLTKGLVQEPHSSRDVLKF